MERTKHSCLSGIYQIQSKINGKIYVGSAVDLKHRRCTHFCDLKKEDHHSILLQRHYNKYGIKDLQFIVLERCVKENLIEREQYYIDTLKPFFNICKIAGSNLNIKWSEEVKQNMSKAQLRRFEDPKEREYLSKVHKGLNAGEKHPMFGKHHTEESNQKNREAKKLFYQTEEGKICRENLRELLIKRFENPEERKKVSDAKKGNTNMLGKHHSAKTRKNFSIVRTGKVQSKETVAKRVEKNKGQFRVSVNQYTLDGVFIKTIHGYNEIKQLGVQCSNVYKCIKGLRKTVGGFIWKLAA